MLIYEIHDIKATIVFRTIRIEDEHLDLRRNIIDKFQKTRRYPITSPFPLIFISHKTVFSFVNDFVNSKIKNYEFSFVKNRFSTLQ